MLKEPLGTTKDQLSFFQISKETVREVKTMSQLRHLQILVVVLNPNSKSVKPLTDGKK